MDIASPASPQRAGVVTVRDGKAGLPYSKGLMATSIMAAGLPPSRAYKVAEVIERRLYAGGRDSVASGELRELAARVLEDEVGPRYADNYRAWQRAQDRSVPLIVLIGGATGVGKSTIATTVAARLGIVRIVSTDAVREVMRGIFTREMMPSIYASSFDAADHLPEQRGELDPVVGGFRSQVQAVSVGVSQIVRRAVVEGTDVIVEGAHVVPGFLRLPSRVEAVVAPMVITVDDEAIHRNHFVVRSQDTRSQRDRDYLRHFQAIRTVQSYVRALALEHGVPVVPSYSLDATVSRVMELIVSATTDSPDHDHPTTAAPTAPTPSPGPAAAAAARPGPSPLASGWTTG